MQQSQQMKTSSAFRIRNKSDIIQYIPNQQQSDNKISHILNNIRQFNSAFELGWQTKIDQIVNKINNNINKVDTLHRSYWKVKSLILGCNVMMLLSMGQVEKVHELIIQEEMVVEYIKLPEYMAKMYLLKIVALLNIPKEEEEVSEFVKNSVKFNYNKFCKIKFEIDSEGVEVRFWEHGQLLELLVYQYLLIIHKLSEKNAKKATMLYKKGLNIATLLLGKNHKLVNMMEKINQMRKNTNKLLKNTRSKSMVVTAKGKIKKNNLKFIKTHSEFHYNRSHGPSSSVNTKLKTQQSMLTSNYSNISNSKHNYQMYQNRQNPQNKSNYRVKKQKKTNQSLDKSLDKSQEIDLSKSHKNLSDLYVPSNHNDKKKTANKLGGKIIHQEQKLKQSQQNLSKLVQLKTKGQEDTFQMSKKNGKNDKIPLLASERNADESYNKGKIQSSHGQQSCCQLI